jgi:hypothetical protein
MQRRQGEEPNCGLPDWDVLRRPEYRLLPCKYARGCQLAAWEEMAQGVLLRVIQKALEENTVVLAEVSLGSAVAGEDVFAAQELGFDPTRQSWALTFLLREPAP